MVEVLEKLGPHELGLTNERGAVAHLVGFLQRGGTNERRLAASGIRKLAGAYPEECNRTVPVLLGCLEDPAPQVRQYALKALLVLELPAESRHQVQRVCLQDDKDYNRKVAAQVLRAGSSPGGAVAPGSVSGSQQDKDLGQAVRLEKERQEGSKDLTYRNRFPAVHRCMDGHYVRSRAEVIVDNWLYASGVLHAYERRVPISPDLYCDFYIPAGEVYVEYWGLEGDAAYERRKRTKQELYRSEGLNLIELTNANINNLDDTFPPLLLEYGVAVR